MTARRGRGATAALWLAIAAAVVPAGCATLLGYEFGSSSGVRIRLQATGEAPCVLDPNECGPTGVLGLLVPNCPLGLVCFDEFCNGHDICYATCGSDKEACDEQFFTNMRFRCASLYDDDDPQREVCEGLAYIYWQIVVRFGGSFFDRTQQVACFCEELEAAGSIEEAQELLAATLGARLDAVAPFDDDDDDLLPDAWELRYGCDPANPDTLADYDGDGTVNLQEYLSGSDPLLPDAPPAEPPPPGNSRKSS